MSEPTSASLVPPRPNPGPEPIDRPRSDGSGMVQLAVVVVSLLLLALLAHWRLRRRRVLAKQESAGIREITDAPTSSTERIIEISNLIRSELSSRFDSSYRARTTEEISDDQRIQDALGSDDHARLIELMQTADRLKFSAMYSTSLAAPQLSESADVAEALLRRVVESQRRGRDKSAVSNSTQAS